MAIVENRASEDGDVIVIKTNVPVVGIVVLTSFIDNTEGETGSIYFVKTFHYSTNGGLTFSDWIELTTVNIQNIVIERIDYFIVEYRYKRTGVGADLTFNSIHLGGTLDPLSYPVFNSMIYSEFFTPDNIDVLRWAINVLEKLFKRGIIPSYVVRNQGGDDKDFVSYWFTITHFFAILVYYARGFENLPASLYLMREFVKGRGVYMRNNPDVEELFYVYNNYITEIALRGTKEIHRRESATFDMNSSIYYGGAIGAELIDPGIDGELLRLLDAVAIDEFMFAYTTRGELGWCIGQSSPLYTGADGIKNLIKAYEYDEVVGDLANYPLVNDTFIAIVNDKMQITNVPAGENAGIADAFQRDKAIVVDPTLDYELSFKVEKSELIGDLTFGIYLFDANFNGVAPVSIVTGAPSGVFFSKAPLNLVNTEYWIRAVLYSASNPLIADDVLNIGFGESLRMPATTRYIMPLLLVENDGGTPLTDVVTISDIKVRPAALWFSRGTLSARNFIIGYIKNNSTEYNNQQVEKIINEELIPYNTYTLLKFL